MGLVIDGKQNKIYQMDEIYERTKEENIDGWALQSFATNGAIIDWTWNDSYSWTLMSGEVPIANYKVTVFPVTLSSDKKSVTVSWKDYNLQSGEEIAVNLSDTEFEETTFGSSYAYVSKGTNKVNWYDNENINLANNIDADVSWDYDKKTFTLYNFNYTPAEDSSDSYYDMTIKNNGFIATLKGKENIRKLHVSVNYSDSLSYSICYSGTIDTPDYEKLNFKEVYRFRGYNDAPDSMRNSKYWFILKDDGTVVMHFQDVAKPQQTKSTEGLEKNIYTINLGFQYDDYIIKTYNIKIIGNILYSEN